jgi:ABC-type Fe3+/spermidine/putrescine transport system ATPase subunit
VVRIDEGLLVHAADFGAFRQGERVLVVIRKERLSVEPGPARGAPNELPARVEFVNYLGSTIQYFCSVEQKRVLVSLRNEAGAPTLRAGEEVRLSFRPEDCLCLRAE